MIRRSSQPPKSVTIQKRTSEVTPHPNNCRLGGYETRRAKSSYLEVEASEKITAKLLELLDQLSAQN